MIHIIGFIRLNFLNCKMQLSPVNGSENIIQYTEQSPSEIMRYGSDRLDWRSVRFLRLISLSQSRSNVQEGRIKQVQIVIRFPSCFCIAFHALALSRLKSFSNYCTVYNRYYTTTAKYTNIPEPFLGNGWINTFPQQKTRT
jgi:hypothetical protein